MKHFFFAVLLWGLLNTLSSRSQVPLCLWAKDGGGIMSDRGTALALDKKGHVYYTGSFMDTALFAGTTLIAEPGTSKGFVAKYNVDGQPDWAVQIGGNDNKLAADSAGNVFIAGNFLDSIVLMDSVLYGAGPSDGFIAKLDTSGHLLWAHRVGGPGEEYIYSACSDAGGNFYVTGIFKNQITIGDTTLLSVSNNYSIFVARYNTAGALVWVAQAGGPGIASVSAYGITADSAGYSYICGGYNGASGLGEPSWGNTTLSGSYNDYIARLDPSGNWVWAVDVAYNPSAGMVDIAVDKTGNVFALGNFGYSGNSITVGGQTINPWGSSMDMYLSKWDASGTFQWVRSGGSYNAFDDAKAIALDDSGNVYITGVVYDSVRFGTHIVDADSSNNIAIVKYNTAGAEEWIGLAGGAGIDEPADIGADTSGAIYLTGLYTDSAGFDTLALYNGGTYGNAFLVKFGFGDTLPVPSSVNAMQITSAENILVYPNPVSDNLNVDIRQGAIHHIEVNGIDGRSYAVPQSYKSDNNVALHTKELAQGVYFITVYTTHSRLIKKFIKE